MLQSRANSLRIVYAGDREISVSVLRHILQQGVYPISLLTSDSDTATHASELVALCDHLDTDHILEGDQFRTTAGTRLLEQLRPHYIVCVHFPYLIPKSVLDIPEYGVLNLHPAYLPYNRGWHTPSWAIWDDTPYGATLHFMDEGVDTGDIVCQRQLDALPNDTAHTLYQRVTALEYEVFLEAWPSIVSATCDRRRQMPEEGTVHRRGDLGSIRHVDLNACVKAGDLIRLLRALTTNDIRESAYFEIDGQSYHMRLEIAGEHERQ